MEDLIGFQKVQIEALRIENERLTKQLHEAKELLKEVAKALTVNDFEVMDNEK